MSHKSRNDAQACSASSTTQSIQQTLQRQRHRTIQLLRGLQRFPQTRAIARRLQQPQHAHYSTRHCLTTMLPLITPLSERNHIINTGRRHIFNRKRQSRCFHSMLSADKRVKTQQIVTHHAARVQLEGRNDNSRMILPLSRSCSEVGEG